MVLFISHGYELGSYSISFFRSGPNFTPAHRNMQEYDKIHAHLDQRYLSSVDISWQDAKVALKKIGFEILEENVGIHSHYTNDESSMMSTEFRCVFFVAKKKVHDYP